MLRIDRPTTLKFSQSLERKFHSIASSCLRYGLCQELVHSSVISSATWIFSAATRIDLSEYIEAKALWRNAALFINNSDLLFAKQLLQSANENETSAEASAELWKRLVDFSSARFLYRRRVCDFFIILKRKSV